jgi:hypothetical protein
MASSAGGSRKPGMTAVRDRAHRMTKRATAKNDAGRTEREPVRQRFQAVALRS